MMTYLPPRAGKGGSTRNPDPARLAHRKRNHSHFIFLNRINCTTAINNITSINTT